MSHVASAALVEALDGSGLYTEERNLALREQVPAELRLTEFSPAGRSRIIPRFAGGSAAGRSGAALIWVRCPNPCSATWRIACGG